MNIRATHCTQGIGTIVYVILFYYSCKFTKKKDGKNHKFTDSSVVCSVFSNANSQSASQKLASIHSLVASSNSKFFRFINLLIRTLIHECDGKTRTRQQTQRPNSPLKGLFLQRSFSNVIKIYPKHRTQYANSAHQTKRIFSMY